MEPRNTTGISSHHTQRKLFSTTSHCAKRIFRKRFFLPEDLEDAGTRHGGPTREPEGHRHYTDRFCRGFLDLGCQIIVLGDGDREYHDQLQALRDRNPERKLGIYLGFNESLAHIIEAGSDLFLYAQPL